MSGNVLNIFGKGFTKSWRGRSVTFSPLDNVEVVALYQQYLEGQAWKALMRAKQFLSPEEYEARAEGVARDCAAGVYSFGSRTFLTSLQNVENLKQALWLCAVRNDPEVTRELFDRVAREDAEFFASLCTEMLRGQPDPNGTPPTPPVSA